MTHELEPWSKESPTTDGVYWWRADASDSDPDIHLVQGKFFYQVGFASSEVVANFGGEWLGPITPALTDEVTRLREALEWQPIETVPKDGSEVLLGHANSMWVDEWVEFDDGAACWMMCDQWSDPETPTHWKRLGELPPALQPKAEGEREK